MDSRVAKALDALCAPFSVAEGETMLSELRRRVEIAKGLRRTLKEIERSDAMPMSLDISDGFMLGSDAAFDFSGISDRPPETDGTRPVNGPQLVRHSDDEERDR